MKNFLALFTRNWGLKLLALVLALVVFYGVRGSIRGPQPNAFAPQDAPQENAAPRLPMKGSTNAAPIR